MTKPTFYFFKMFGCSACEQFEAVMFRQLLADPEIRQHVVLEQVSFGRDHKGDTYTLETEFPDFAEQIQYAPYIWMGKAYDEDTQTYHLQPATMRNKSLNLRQDGRQYEYGRESTYPELRNWILQGARASTGSAFHSRSGTRSR